MSPWLAALGIGAAIVAAVVHVAIFVLESLLFDRASVQRMFGVRPEAVSRPLLLFAVLQGIYNLTLAITVFVGITVSAFSLAVGLAIVTVALTIMVVAAGALAASSPRSWPFALLQGGPALVGLATVATTLLGL